MEYFKENKECLDKQVIFHPGKNLKKVMQDVFEKYPEESFYFLNEGTLRRTAHIFQEFFLPQDDRRRIAYAVKANPHLEVLRILSEAGINSFDCASLGEIKKVKSITPESEIFFNNPHKKSSEINNSLDNDVIHFTADILDEVKKILSLSNKKSITPEIAIRLKTLNKNGAVINLSDKFGATKGLAREMFSYLKQENNKECVSMNIGSQVTDLDSYKNNIFQLFEFIKSMRMKILSLNVGGGVPVLLSSSVQENELLLKKYLTEITRNVEKGINDVLMEDENSKIIIEPGRSMVASSIDLGVSILNNHAPRDKILTIDDGIFTSFGDSVIHSWEYKMHGIDNTGKRILGDTDEYCLHGRTCDSGDIISRQKLVNGLTSNDYLHIPNAGAYLSSQATNFNGYEPHSYVLYNC